MTEGEFMSLGFYALLRVLYSLWTSITKIHLYNCLRKETLGIARGEMPTVLWRHFSRGRRGGSSSTDTPECTLRPRSGLLLFGFSSLSFVGAALLRPQTSAVMKNTACEKLVVLLHLPAMMYWWYYSQIP